MLTGTKSTLGKNARNIHEQQYLDPWIFRESFVDELLVYVLKLSILIAPVSSIPWYVI